ncbi:cation-transporting P-type ATPase [Salisediminibacterium halotolerans]|uniref:cation-transporting P-type ATPase n=1 Tax=Salisediminibacterium halotolerans TaxID=517425 RepID=UPI000EB1026B|nr:cation-transporting P-type ATPase [Salisediminibacterium halotolerans]RLJ80900.1 calcium-translocating P-type ATPase/potassium/sodium efflux P-type ATPase,TIGR01523 [Actinophytocola xinjiangensis]RPE83913.1 calcium-translocating P-type ATPase/potassium/sodium efflux P-type ATPase,TIGR01523 [Salisediminibacterium halotolerans]TWG37843.1 calcium-translocating P-type ATPase/potassium/sodium efflux P-type ATPase,TIGR01523 [Salisediminibacterium halotolerans]GEL08700.1 carbonate dehydratase [Sali
MSQLPEEQKNWHAMNDDDVVEAFQSDTKNGLSKDEAAKRLENYGKNELPEKEDESAIIKYFKHFHDVLIYILLAAAVITFALGHYIDTAVILLVAVINATVGFMQESKAEKALEGIKNMLSAEATVLRNGEKETIDAGDVVLGDIVYLAAGDKIPADMRLIQADNLKAEEAALTGESTSADKDTETLDEDTVLGDRVNIAFSGTSITSGTGVGVVTATAEKTEIGKINESIAEVEELKTPLMKQTDKFGKQVAVFIVIASIFIYAFGFFVRDYGAIELLMSIIGLAVASIPEGLPAIISIILALGVQNMAKRKSIVRNLPSVETLGAVSVINSDKTGTLTKNEMTVTAVMTRNDEYEVTGTGYAPNGDIKSDDEKVNVNEHPDLKTLLTAMKTCNDASLKQEEDGQWKINGEPTEGCLLTLAEKADADIPKLEVQSKIPFDSAYKYMAVLVEDEGEKVIYIKGAPDRLFDMAANGENGFDRDYWEKQMKTRTTKGERVLSAGYKKVDASKTEIDHEDLEDGVQFIGLTGIIDPPREEAILAVEECKKAGISVKMITGDHKDTAVAIGKQMGIGDGERGLEGIEIDKMSDEELSEAIMEYDVFARTSPDNKLRIVEALQANEQISAMTGDGVNDAPALKRADIGVAMGIKGTEVAKESSQMVLVDDNFETIVGAVEEGRRVYANLKKTILFILPTNGAQAFVIMASILLGTTMPLTPIQILWVNMVIAITVSMALAFEPLEEGAMQRPPRNVKTPLLTPYYIFRIVFVSLLIGGGTLALSMMLMDGGNYSESMMNTVVLHTIVMMQMFHLYNTRNEIGYAFNRNFFKNKVAFIVSGILILLQLSILYVPFMNTAFETEPLGIEFWIIPILMGIAAFILIEIEKTITRRIINGRNNIS